MSKAPRNHVLPYEGPLHMATEMVERLENHEEIDMFEFKWCIHGLPPKGENLWRFHMELLAETRTREFGKTET